MGLTYAQAKALGLGSLHPAASGQTDAEVLRRLGVEDVVPQGGHQPGDGMNKTERSFAETLNQHMDEILVWYFGSFKLRLAGATWYTPDFYVNLYSHRPTLVEVKGFFRDDAAVKLKVAAETYPCFRWLLVRREGRHGWNVREITRTGIGVHPIQVPWITGGGA